MPQRRPEHREIGPWRHEDVERAIRDDDIEALLVAVIGVSMHDDDWSYAQDLCVRLSTHPHFNVRGNAVLGFAHIARVHRRLDRAVVQPIIQRALRDEHDYVRGHADSAVDDTQIYLKWRHDDKTVA
jgi:hypothetical protein